MSSLEIPGYTVGTWTIDPAHSEVGFVVRHMMVSKVRGGFTSFEGTINTALEPLQSSAVASIDLTSITTNNEQRDTHLRSADFLHTESDPKMTFHSSGLRLGGPGMICDGDLTIRGITHPISLEVEVNGIGPDAWGGTRLGLSATGHLNRADYGVNWNAALEGGGVVVSDKVQIVLEIQAVLEK
jgi:polyisoprenoid-binding protein YceI